MATWGFFTNHAHALVYIAQNPGATVREMAAAIGITERAALTILRDLRREGIVAAKRTGRRNAYAIDFQALARYRPWAPSPTPVPQPLIEAAVSTLSRIADRNSRSD